MYNLSALLPSSKRQGEHDSPHDQKKESKKNKKDKNRYGTNEDRPRHQFTPLTVPLGEVYAQMDPDQLPKPKKMKMFERKKYTSKYCRYHKDHGHETSDC